MSVITPNNFTWGSVRRRDPIVSGNGLAEPDPRNRVPTPISGV